MPRPRKLSEVQKRMLRQSQRKRNWLKRRTEIGRPVDATLPKTEFFMERFLKSKLPREIKLKELEKWADMLAVHLKYRMDEFNLPKKQTKRLNEKTMKKELMNWLMKQYPF